jgi:hypothetical protein
MFSAHDVTVALLDPFLPRRNLSQTQVSNRVACANRTARPIPRKRQTAPFQVVVSKEVHRISRTAFRRRAKETHTLRWVLTRTPALQYAGGCHVLGNEVAGRGCALKPPKSNPFVPSNTIAV